jgi:hypothetical protein
MENCLSQARAVLRESRQLLGTVPAWPLSTYVCHRAASRKQTFAVLPHRQDCALAGRSTEVRLCSKADVRSAAVIEWAKSGHPMPNSKCLRPLTAFQPSASDAFRTSPPLCPSRFSYSSLWLRSRPAVHAIPKLVVPNRGSARPKRKSSLRYRRSSRSVSPCQNSTSSAPSFLSQCGRQSPCLCFVSAKPYSERVSILMLAIFSRFSRRATQ